MKNLSEDIPTAAEEVDGGVETDQTECLQLLVGVDAHHERIDRFLVAEVPGFSRSYLSQLVVQGAVTINAVAVRKPAHKVRAGDTVTVEVRPTQQAMAFKPEPVPLSVVFEDAHLAVIDKPAGLVVHPGAGNWTGTLLNGLLHRYPDAVHLPRAGIVHRLDKDTSGLMVVARSRQAFDQLTLRLAARDVHRVYLAICHGRWLRSSDASLGVSLTQAIGRDVKNRLRMAALERGVTHGKPARTDVYVLDTQAAHSLVRCKLHTGRTHQIRVHMAAANHPLVGDVLYGGKAALGMTRQSLHAHQLSFHHPVTEALLSWVSDLPTDFNMALTAAGLHYNGEHVLWPFQG